MASNKKVVLQKKSKPKDGVQAKIKKVTSKSQAKTKRVTLKAKAKTAQVKAKKVVSKTKKTQVKTKKIAFKSKTTVNKMAEGVSQRNPSTEIALDFAVQPHNLEKNKEYMNKEQLDHFCSILLQWKERLMEESDHTMPRLQDEASNYPDPVDRASKEEELGLELNTWKRKHKLLKKIEEALVRFSDNSYGYCDNCGAEIGVHRLEVHPTATQCIDCRAVTEVKKRQIGGAVVAEDSMQD